MEAHMDQRPGQVNAMGIMTIVSGFINISAGIGYSAAAVLGTLFIGIVCLPITLIPVVLGVFEVIYGIKVLSDKPVSNTTMIGAFEIGSILWGNILSAGIGVAVLILNNDPIVEAYFSSQPSTAITEIEEM